MQREEIVAYMISESVTPSKHIILNSSKCDTAIVEAELQDADEFNRNKRNYGYDVLNDGLNKPNIKELIARKSWVGEAGHPMGATLQRQMSIDHERISHRILKWWWEGHKVKGLIETMPYGYGIQMRNFIRSELETAYSLRAVGPVKRTTKGDIVQKPLSIMTYDWVFIPSHRQSYQSKIITGTGANQTDNQGQLTEGYCIEIFRQDATDYIKNESKNFKLISEFVDMSQGDVMLSEDNKNLIYTTSDGKTTNKMHMKIEDYILRDINGYMNNIGR